jgi:hypothetical protein
MEQGQVSVKRSSLSVGDSLMVKEGKEQMIHVNPPLKQMRSTVSFPLEPGEHQHIAVKVSHFRGNEVVRVIPLPGGVPYAS